MLNTAAERQKCLAHLNMQLYTAGENCLVTEHDQYMSKAPRLIMFCVATKYVFKFFNFFATEFGTLRYTVSGKYTFRLLSSKDKCMDLFFLSGHGVLKLKTFTNKPLSLERK